MTAVSASVASRDVSDIPRMDSRIKDCHRGRWWAMARVLLQQHRAGGKNDHVPAIRWRGRSSQSCSGTAIT
jgi:hypothetical protein